MQNLVSHQSEVKRLPYRFEINPNARHSSKNPIQLYSKSVHEAIRFQYAPYTPESILILSPEENNPLDLYGPNLRISYPTASGSYLVIETRSTGSLQQGSERPSLLLVLNLREPVTISRVSLMGNLLIPPVYDDRGPESNFGLPKTIKIYTVDYWPTLQEVISNQKPIPHPRDWRQVYENNDLRALWGWTPLTFHPVHCSFLIFDMSEFPILWKDQKYGVVRGLSIQRLGVHSYVQSTNSEKDVEFSPVTSWQSEYEPQPNPFESKYWKHKGISTVVQDQHQSIYRDEILKDFKYPDSGFDLLPSTLIDLPPEYKIQNGSFTLPQSLAEYGVKITNGYWTLSYYSGDVIKKDESISTNLIVQVIEDEMPFIEGMLLEEKLPRGVENTTEGYPDSIINLYYTDEPDVAFSPNSKRVGWKLIRGYRFSGTFEPYGLQVIFPYEINARFYRIEHRFQVTEFYPPRRFELSKLKLLRARHRPLVACKDETLQLEEVRLKLKGKNLIDDYAYVNGKDIMDLIFEASTQGQPFQPFLSLRNVLDIREKTRSQFIVNARSTRPYEQIFHERTRQGAQMEEDYGRGKTMSTVLSSLSINKQHLLLAAEDHIKDHPAINNLPSNLRNSVKSIVINLLSQISGITTDRDVKLESFKKSFETLKLIAYMFDIPASDLKELLRLPQEFSGKDLSDLLKFNLDLDGKLRFPGLPLGADGPFDADGKIISSGSLKIPDIPKLVGDQFHEVMEPLKILQVLYGLGSSISIDDVIGILNSIPYRPSTSISGSFGGQFFGGGSYGVSLQADAGKTTSVSDGNQGQANESVNIQGIEPSIDSSDISRYINRFEDINSLREYVWKGKEVRFEGEETDMVLLSVPTQVVLRTPHDPKDQPDTFRIRVGYLPPTVELDVKFLGVAVPQESEPKDEE